MNFQYLATFTILISFLMLLLQRTETSKRRIMIAILIIPAILIRRWAIYRNMETELIVAILLALVANVLFWLLIGKYNPVPSSDEIKILKLDD